MMVAICSHFYHQTPTINIIRGSSLCELIGEFNFHTVKVSFPSDLVGRGTISRMERSN